MRSARGLHIAYGMPPICHLSPSEPHRDFIGTLSGLHRRNTEGTPGEYAGDNIILEQSLAQSDKESPPLHFTPYTLH